MPTSTMKEKKIEIEYFNDTPMPWRKGAPTNYLKGLEWYESFFSHCNKDSIRGEASPTYLHAPEVPERIKNTFPNVKLIAILREPLSRLVSYYNYLSANKNSRERIPSTFSEFIRMPGVAELNLYHSFLQNYLRFFEKEQIKIMIYEDIGARPLVFMHEIYDFLKIDHEYISPVIGKKVNSAESRQVAERYHVNMERYGKVGAKIFSYFELLFPTTNISTFSLLDVSKEDKEYLGNLYASELTALEKYLGRTLYEWRYPMKN